MKQEFFSQNAVQLARSLLGTILVRKKENQIFKGVIVETEAYMGEFDKASHCYQHKKTPRTMTMFKKGGTLYVYRIYGIYHCLNIVCGKEGSGEAVLIRALEPLCGIDQMKKNRKTDQIINLTNGPGKLCMAMDITTLDNGQMMNCSGIYLEKQAVNENVDTVERPRINIAYAEEAADFLWRFYIKGNAFVSKK